MQCVSFSTDVDECSNSTLNDCDINASCTDTIGGFQCECGDGYVGNGSVCVGKEK